MHIKRKTIENFWPIQRTGSKYVAVPSHDQRSALPLIIVIRDLLAMVKTKKELKKLLNEKKITVNEKIVRETNYPLRLYDSLGFPSLKKYYKISLKKRFVVIPASESEAREKIVKVIGKKLLPGKKVQLHLTGGRTVLSNEKADVGDFAVIDLLKNKITKIIQLKKDTEILVIAGKHIGKTGKIKEIAKEGAAVVATIKTHDGEIKANIKNVFAKE